MRKIKEVLRLRYELKLDQRQIARSCSIAVSTVHEYLKRAEAAKVSWPLPDGWDDTRLEAALYPCPEAKAAAEEVTAGLRRSPRATPHSPPRDHAVALGKSIAKPTRRATVGRRGLPVTANSVGLRRPVPDIDEQSPDRSSNSGRSALGADPDRSGDVRLP